MAQATGERVGSAPSTRTGWVGNWNSAVTSYYLLIGSTAILVLLGLVMVLSSSSVQAIADQRSAFEDFVPQATYAAGGLVLMLVAVRLPIVFYKRAAWPFLGLTLVVQALIFVPAFSLSKGGNNAWIAIGPVSGQPSEFVKVSLAIWLGLVLGRKQRLLGQWRHALLPGAVGAVLAVGLVLGGHDLGTSMIMMLLVAGAYWVAGVDWRLFAGAGVLLAVGVVGLFVVGNSNRMDRIMTTYGSCSDAQDACYQSIHGMYGLGTGGLMGVGLGASREKYGYLPAAHNDFIFSVLGEETGLAGTLVVLLLFGVLGFAMSRVVRRHPDPFVKITTAAIACWIVGQALINIGVVIGVFPVIGVPLPLMSSGGSALIATMLALGVVIAFARDEPGARAALAARPSVARRSFAVMSGAARRVRLPRGGRARV